MFISTVIIISSVISYSHVLLFSNNLQERKTEMMEVEIRWIFQREQHQPKVNNNLSLPKIFSSVLACLKLQFSSVSTSGYELLFQPEVVRVYTSLLRESKNPSVLEAAAGAIQNLCAGRWTVSTFYT